MEAETSANVNVGGIETNPNPSIAASAFSAISTWFSQKKEAAVGIMTTEPIIELTEKEIEAAAKQAREASRLPVIAKCATGIQLDWYQRAVIDRMVSRCNEQRGLLVLHRMGSGKTLTTIGTLVNTDPRIPLTFVCPEGLDRDFLGDTDKFFPANWMVKQGGTDKLQRDPGKAQFLQRFDQRKFEPLLNAVNPVAEISKLPPEQQETELQNLGYRLGFGVKAKVNRITKEDLQSLKTMYEEELQTKYGISIHNRILSYKDLEYADNDVYFEYLKARFKGAIVALDESHNLIELISTDNKLLIKKAKRIRQLFQMAKRLIMLTGTPIVNNWPDMAELINICAGDYILPPLWSKFSKRYAVTGPLKDIIGEAEAVVTLPDRLEKKIERQVDKHIPLFVQLSMSLIGLDPKSWATKPVAWLKALPIVSFLTNKTMVGKLRMLNKEFNKGKINPYLLYKDIAPYISYFDYVLDYTQAASFPTSRVLESRFAYSDYQLRLLVSLYANQGLTEKEMAVLRFATDDDPYMAAFNEVSKQSFIDKGRAIGNLSRDNLTFKVNLTTPNVTKKSQDEATKRGLRYTKVNNIVKSIESIYNLIERILSVLGVFVSTADHEEHRESNRNFDMNLNFHPKYKRFGNDWFRNIYRFANNKRDLFDGTENPNMNILLGCVNKFKELQKEFGPITKEGRVLEARSLAGILGYRINLFVINAIIADLPEEKANISKLKDKLYALLDKTYKVNTITRSGRQEVVIYRQEPGSFFADEQAFYKLVNQPAESLTLDTLLSSTTFRYIKQLSDFIRDILQLLQNIFSITQYHYNEIFNEILVKDLPKFEAIPRDPANKEPIPMDVFGCPKYYRLLNQLIELRQTKLGIPIVYSNFEETGYQTFGAYLTARGYNYLVYDKSSPKNIKDYILNAVTNEFFYEKLWTNTSRNLSRNEKTRKNEMIRTLNRRRIEENMDAAANVSANVPETPMPPAVETPVVDDRGYLRQALNYGKGWFGYGKDVAAAAVAEQKQQLDEMGYKGYAQQKGKNFMKAQSLMNLGAFDAGVDLDLSPEARAKRREYMAQTEEIKRQSTLAGNLELSKDWNFAKKEKKTRPLCVLLHPGLTEGVSFTHSSDIFVIEPCLGAGKTDQVYARILRKYDGGFTARVQRGVIQRPEKYIHQFLSSFRLGSFKFYSENRIPIRDNILIPGFVEIYKFTQKKDPPADWTNKLRRDIDDLFKVLDEQEVTALNFFNEEALNRLGKEEYRNYLQSNSSKNIGELIEQRDLGEIEGQYQTPDDIQYQRNNTTRDLMNELFEVTAGIPNPRPKITNKAEAIDQKVTDFQRMWTADANVACLNGSGKTVPASATPNTCQPSYCAYYDGKSKQDSAACKSTCVKQVTGNKFNTNPGCLMTKAQYNAIQQAKRNKAVANNRISINNVSSVVSNTESLPGSPVSDPGASTGGRRRTYKKSKVSVKRMRKTRSQKRH